MRTTVTLDSDVAALLGKVTAQTGASFKKALNDAVRAGIGSRSTQKFVSRTHQLGEPLVSLDKALSIAADMEDDEIVHKLQLRK